MHLNPTKCVFVVNLKKNFKFLVHQQGINTNPKKVQEITPLNQFLSQLGDKCLHFFSGVEELKRLRMDGVLELLTT